MATVEGPDVVRAEMGIVKCPLQNGVAIGSPVSLGIRPECVELRAEPAQAPNSFSGTIEGRMFLGDAASYWVRIGQARLMVKPTEPEFPSNGPINVVMPKQR